MIPDRVITQMSTSTVDGVTCPEHENVSLHWLPQPCDVPVILAAR
ncbi:hypothetical protein [Kibdelosporangium philippinense]